MMLNYTFPVSGNYSITSPFGQRSAPTAGATTNHQGIDISVPLGTTVMSVMAGKVIAEGYTGARGNYVVVDHGSGITTLYEHMSKVVTQIGETVNAGQKIGLSGKSGIVTGPNLHYEVHKNGKAVNPLTFDGAGISGSSNLVDQINTDGILKILKEKWWIVAGALVSIAIIKR
jgi:murein DD-endopeptidase MepM/ murein hydrolase activator NlpD